MNEWSIMLPLLAIALAIIGYRHLAKRQPEYPNGQVIGVFTLLDGGLGGLLIIVFAMVLGALSGCGGLIVFAPRQFALNISQTLATSTMQPIVPTPTMTLPFSKKR